MPIEITAHTPKGGGGKTTFCVLGVEFFSHHGYRVKLVDADIDQCSQEWVDNTRDKGRDPVVESKPDIIFNDTKGSTKSAQAFIKSADLIVCPIDPSGFDLSKTIDLALGLPPDRQQVLAFLPTRLDPLGCTKEEAAALDQVRQLIEQIGAHPILPGTILRRAVYKPLYDGHEENFFDRSFPTDTANQRAQAERFQKAQDEMIDIFSVIASILNIQLKS